MADGRRPGTDRRRPSAFPRWPRYDVTPELIAAWKRAMVERKVSRTELAKAVGLTQGGVTRLLDGQQASSARVPAICAFLGVPTPAAPLPDEVAELAKQLSDETRDQVVLPFLRLLVRQKK